MRLLVVIVNYRSARLTINCVRSLIGERSANPGLEVRVVENASGDAAALRSGLAAQIAEGWVKLDESPVNGGFAHGNNRAVRATLRDSSPPRYVLMLNPDAEVRPGAVRALVDFMESHPRAGVAGASLENEDGSDWPIAFRFPTVLGELEGQMQFGPVTRLLQRYVVARPMERREAQIDWVPGAAMIVRREVFENAGLMDEQYFLYYEETDFCLAARRAGWECWYAPKARVMHIAGQSTGVTVRTVERPKRLPSYWFESRRRYFLKNHGVPYAVAADAAYVIGLSFARVRRIVSRRPETSPPRIFRDFLLNSTFRARNRATAPAAIR